MSCIHIERYDQFAEIIDRPEIEYDDVTISINMDAVIKVYGDRYHGTLTPELVQGLASFQEELVKSYCILRYGTANRKRLGHYDQQILRSLEFSVKEGCSTILIEKLTELFGSMKGFLEMATLDMSGRQRLLLVSMLVLAAGGCFIANDLIDLENKKDQRAHERQMKQLENEQDAKQRQSYDSLIREFLSYNTSQDEQTFRILRGIERTNSAQRSLAIAPKDASKVSINGEIYSRVELDEIRNNADRENAEVELVEDGFTTGIEYSQLSKIRLRFRSSYFDKTIILSVNPSTVEGLDNFDQLKDKLVQPQTPIKIRYKATMTSDDEKFIEGTLLEVLER